MATKFGFQSPDFSSFQNTQPVLADADTGTCPKNVLNKTLQVMSHLYFNKRHPIIIVPTI